MFWLLCFTTSSNTLALAERLAIGGSGSMIGAARSFSELFEKSRPGLRIDLEPGSSASAITGVRAGRLDVGLVGHAISLTDRTGFHVVPVKKEAILLMTYPTNPVTGLSLAQICGIYLGQISNWAQVGGEDQAIVPFTRRKNSMIRRIFLGTAFGNDDAVEEKAFRIAKDKVLRTLRKIKGSLGFAPTSVEIAEASGVKILAVDGNEPTRQNVRQGAYPFSRTLLVISADPPSGIVLEWINGFVRFVQKDSGTRQP